MKIFNIFSVLSLAFALGAGSAIKRDELTVNDAETKNALDDFILAIINNFKTVIVEGNECLGIPPLDPLALEGFALNITTALLKMRGNVSNIQSTGLNGLEATYISCNLLTLKVDLVMEMPSLFVGGHYDVDGLALLIFPIYGRGPFSLNIGDVKIAGGGQLAARLNGSLFMRQLDFTIEVGSLAFNFEGLLGGGELGDVLNQIVNEMGLAVYNEVRKMIHDTLMSGMLQFINAQLKDITLADIIGGIISPSPPEDGECVEPPAPAYYKKF